MKNILISLSLLLFSTLLVAQVTTFNKRLDFDMLAATAGGLAATDSCLYMSGIVVMPETPNQVGSLFACFDWDGNLLHHKILNNPEKSYETWYPNLELTPDGNLVNSGYSFDAEGMSAYIVKYTPQGDTLFLRAFKNPFSNAWDDFFRLDDLVLTPDNGFLLGGGAVTRIPGDEGMVLVKVDSLGRQVWVKTYDTIGEAERGNSVAVNAQGEYMIGGFVFNYNLTDEDDEYFALNRIIKTDSVGNTLWTFEHTTEGYKHMMLLEDMYVEENGDIVCISGYGEDLMPSALIPFIGHQPIVYRVSEEGEVVWETPIVLAVPDFFATNWLRQITPSSKDDAYWVVGQVGVGDGVLNSEPLPQSARQGILAKVSRDGAFLWKRYYHFPGASYSDSWHRIMDMVESPDGGVVMCGRYVEGDDTILQETGEIAQQAWLLKVDEYGCFVPGCHLTDNVELPEEDIILQVYPNPASDYLHVFTKQNALPTDGFFRIIDTQGRVLERFEHRFSEVTHIVPVSDMAAGMYFLQYVEGAVLRSTTSFIIQK